MKRKMYLLLSCILLFVSFVLLGCEEQYRPDDIPEETPETHNKSYSWHGG